MNKNKFLIIPLCLVSTLALAEENTEPSNTTTPQANNNALSKITIASSKNDLKEPLSYEEKFYSTKELSLTTNEKNLINTYENWKTKSEQTSIIPTSQGEITFFYGQQSINVVCAVMQVCDIQLQQGEGVNSIHLGDSSRWVIEPAINGIGETETQHIIIKPLDVGLQTNLVVTTDRRTYHINLKSNRSKLMPFITFKYPNDNIDQFFKHQKLVKQKYIQDNTIPQTKEYLGNLDFEYDIKGDVNWKPVRVYNDTHKTIIQMPKSMNDNEAPTLMAKNNNDDDVIINYRLINDKYVVDTVFDKAILIMGVGSNQEKVTIQRSKR